MSEVTETIRAALTNGLRSDDRAVRSGDSCELMTALRPTPFGARVHETVTIPISSSELTTHSVTIAHPFPQLFIGKAVTLLVTDTKLFTVDMSDWTLTAVTMYDPAAPASPATITGGGGPWHFMDFGSTWMLFNGASVVFKSGWIVSTKTFVDEAITATTGCAFRGQGIMGGFDSTDYWPTAWVDYWNSIPHSTAADTDWNLVPPSPGANWVSWSSVGGGDLLMNRISPSTFNTALAEQVLSNGNFLNSDTDWTLGTGWTVASGVLTYLASGTSTLTTTQVEADQLIALTVGEDYWVEFDAVLTDGNGFTISLGSAATALITQSGHYRIKVTAAGTTTVTISAFGTSTAATARPSGDIDSNGVWTFHDPVPGTSTYYDRLNETSGTVTSPGYVQAPSGTSDNWFRVDMDTFTDGVGITDLVVKILASYTGGDSSGIVTLYNGTDLGTPLETIDNPIIFGGDTTTYTFAQATIDAVTDWTDLVVKYGTDVSSNTTGHQVGRIWVEYNYVAASTFTIDNITVTKDDAEEESMALHYARRNESGAMPMDFQGTVLKTLPLRNQVMVYGVDGVSALIPSSQPFPTFGLREGVHRLGIASRDAAAGDINEHVFVDTSGVLYKVDGEGVIERLGFEEFLSPLLGQQFTINYDPNRQGYHITGDTGSNVESYYLTKENKLSKHHQLVSSIYHRDGGLIGIGEDDATPTTLAWKSNIIDFGWNEIKYLSWVEIAYTNITSLTVEVEYRHAKADSFVSLGTRIGSPDGRFFIGASGVEFQITLAGTTAAGAEIERIDVRYDSHDNRTARSPRRKSPSLT